MNYIAEKRIAATDEICHPVKKAAEVINTNPTLNDIFGSDDPNAFSWQRSFNSLDEASSQNLALDWFTTTIAPSLELPAADNNNNNILAGNLMIQGRSLVADLQDPLEDMSPLQKQTAKQIFERLVGDYERQANFDDNYGSGF